MAAKSLSLVLTGLYLSEINVEISSFFDSGFSVKLGDRTNGFIAESDGIYSVLELRNWLIEKAVTQYPGSGFAAHIDELPEWILERTLDFLDRLSFGTDKSN